VRRFGPKELCVGPQRLFSAVLWGTGWPDPSDHDSRNLALRVYPVTAQICESRAPNDHGQWQ